MLTQPVTYHALGHFGKDVHWLKSEGDVLPGTLDTHARLILSPGEVVIMTTIVHSIGGRSVTWGHRLVKLIAVVS